MAKTGILGQSKPAATTNTLLYNAYVDSSASAALTISNDGTGAAYRVALKRYDQKFTLDASTYIFHAGDVVTNQTFTLDTPISRDALTPGDTLSSDDAEKSALFDSYVIPDFTTIYVKALGIKPLTLEGVTGTISVGDTLTAGTAPDTAVANVYDVYEVGTDTVVWVDTEVLSGTAANFAVGDPLSASSGGSGTIKAGGLGTLENHFIFSTTTIGGTYRAYIQSADYFEVFDDRTYRFDVSDSSMSGLLFQLSDTAGGEFGPDGDFTATADNGTEYTAGKTVNGTAGTAGAYVQYALDGTTLSGTFFYYDGNTGTPANSSYGGTDATGNQRGINITDQVTFEQIRVYNIVGSWVNNVDAFELDGQSYTIETQNSGKWGYVRDYYGTTLEVIRGLNSSAFVATDQFGDSPREAASRNFATISSVDVDRDATPAETYIVQDKTLAANAQDRITSIVIGPGEELYVYSATQNNSFNLVGFEDANSEITLTQFTG
jgi:hypothetical protein